MGATVITNVVVDVGAAPVGTGVGVAVAGTGVETGVAERSRLRSTGGRLRLSWVGRFRVCPEVHI